MNLLGKLSWNAIPLDQPIIMGATAFMVLVVRGVLAWITVKGYWPYLWREWITSVDHKRIGVMYFMLALRHAAARLHRRHHDARAAGGRGRRCAGLPAAGAFRPDLLGARHDHDLLHGDAVRDRR